MSSRREKWQCRIAICISERPDLYNMGLHEVGLQQQQPEHHVKAGGADVVQSPPAHTTTSVRYCTSPLPTTWHNHISISITNVQKDSVQKQVACTALQGLTPPETPPTASAAALMPAAPQPASHPPAALCGGWCSTLAASWRHPQSSPAQNTATGTCA